jgi:exodeoxyribonuclease V alpha subunit
MPSTSATLATGIVPVDASVAAKTTNAAPIEKYLASGMIRGIGPVYAKKLLRAFGDKVFDIIEAEPDRLREVDGIGPVPNRIATAWAEQKVVREIMVFLHSHGVGSARAVRIHKPTVPTPCR